MHSIIKKKKRKESHRKMLKNTKNTFVIGEWVFNVFQKSKSGSK